MPSPPERLRLRARRFRVSECVEWARRPDADSAGLALDEAKPASLMYSARLDRWWESFKQKLRALEPPRTLAIAAAAVFAVSTVARSASLPSKTFWEPGRPALWVLLASGAVSGISATINAVRLSRRNRRST